MNNNATFLLLHPCSARNIDIIEAELLESKLVIETRYRIDDWAKACEIAYKEEFRKHGDEHIEGIYTHIWLNNLLFGNTGAILVLKAKNENLTMQEVVIETVKLKESIRVHLPHTKDGKLALIVDVNKIDVPLRTNLNSGFLKIENDNKEYHFLNDIYAHKGSFVGVYFNYIHSPDAVFEDFIEDFERLKEHNIFDFKKIYTEEQWQICKAMQSYKVIK